MGLKSIWLGLRTGINFVFKVNYLVTYKMWMWHVSSCLKFFNDYITHWLVIKLLCLSFSIFWTLIVSPALFLTIVHFKLYWYLNFLLYSAHTKLLHTFISICAYAFYFYFLLVMFVFLLWPNFCSSVNIEFRCHLLCQVLSAR